MTRGIYSNMIIPRLSRFDEYIYLFLSDEQGDANIYQTYKIVLLPRTRWTTSRGMISGPTQAFRRTSIRVKLKGWRFCACAGNFLGWYTEKQRTHCLCLVLSLSLSFSLTLLLSFSLTVVLSLFHPSFWTRWIVLWKCGLEWDCELNGWCCEVDLLSSDSRLDIPRDRYPSGKKEEFGTLSK